MRKPAPLRCAGLHNLLPVIWRLYFNKLTKLNIQFLIARNSCEAICRRLDRQIWNFDLLYVYNAEWNKAPPQKNNKIKQH